MHELSIARALLQLAIQHRPPGARVEALHVQVGPLQAIDAEAMRFAWQAATFDTDLAIAELRLEMLPWRLHCPACSREWNAESLGATCECGSTRCTPVGGDELQLVYLEVVEPTYQERTSPVGCEQVISVGGFR